MVILVSKKNPTVEAIEPEILNIKKVEERWNRAFSSFGGDIFGVGSFMGGMQNNPFIANQRVKNLNTLPNLGGRDVLEGALQDPQNNESVLRAATHSVLNQTYPLYKLQYLYEGILSYHHYAFPTYVPKEDMSKPRFKNDSILVDKWIKRLDPKKTFRRIVAEVISEGKKSYIVRQKYTRGSKDAEVDYVMLQNLPSEYYRLTGISDDSYYVTSFDFMYFLNPGVTLDQFPPIFKEIFDELRGVIGTDDKGRQYIDASKVERQGVTVEFRKGTWAFWAELPSDLAWMFCFTEADANAVSPFVSLLLMGVDLANYNLLQQQLVSAPLNSIILGEIPLVPETKSTGFQADGLTLSPQAVSMFENSINAMFSNRNIAYKMTPAQKNQMYNVPNIPNSQTIYNEAVKGMSNTSGSSALQSLSDKPSVSQTNNARIIEKRYVDRIYEQFEHFVNKMFEKMYDEGDLSYRWEFKIFGNSLLETQERDALEKSLNYGQTHLLPMYLAYSDLSMLDAVSISDWVDATKLYDKFKPLVNSFTNTGKDGGDDKGGRPKVENPDNDNTADSQDSGANTGETRYSFFYEGEDEEDE